MIQILDKKFEPYLSEEEIRTATKRVAHQLEADLSGQRPVFVCILKGALFFFADLLEELRMPCDIAFYRVSSYSGTQSTNQITAAAPFPRKLDGRVVVIVEDIVETGGSIAFLAEYFRRLGAKEVRVATMLFKPGKYHKSLPIQYIGRSIGDEFIVGYGLDYEQEGRNLPAIYRITDSEIHS